MISKLRDPGAKIKHIDACLLAESQYEKSAGFERFELLNEAGFPIRLGDIDLSTTFCERQVSAPLMISPMTGGVERGAELNRLWAAIAEKFGLPMGVGSQRIAIEQGDRAGYFRIRQYAPKAFIFANLGAANLTRANAVDLSRRAIDMVEANAIFIHFNAMQEACQGSDTDFRDALHSLELICAAMHVDKVKVFAREVGFGISGEAAKRFLGTGVDGLDCSGAGGTSWSKVESMCVDNRASARLGQIFGEWGIPTTQSILNVRRVSSELPLIASGGLRSGLHIAKSIALGADLAGMARPFLLAADSGEQALDEFIRTTLHELRVAMFAAGISSIAELKRQNISLKSEQSMAGCQSFNA